MFSFELKGETHQKRKDILSGLTVALALVPEAIAFAFVAGVEPLVGLYAAVFMSVIAAAIGGRPGMISGATGAMAVVMVSLVAQHGVDYLFATVVLTGVLQILAGVFKLGKFVRLIPHPVMLGFVNGLAIVIFLAQMGHFKEGFGEGAYWMSGAPLSWMAGLILLTMAIIHFLPKLTKAVPSSLVAIVVVSLLVGFFNLDTKTVIDMASVAGGFPSFSFPSVPLNLETLYIIFPYALILAAVGLIESLLTLTLIDEITETRGRANKECIGQGVANTTCGFFGSMGGCAMIGQSIININSGGRGRLSGISAGLFLLAFILFLSSWIELIPIAALVGVMFMVVISTFAWTSLKILNKIPRSDAFVLILVSVVTVFTDLAIAVISGVIVSALVFAWEKAREISAEVERKEGKTIYKLKGSLFFGSIHKFNKIFNPKKDAKEVVIDFLNARVYDHSAIEAIDSLTKKYKKEKKKLHLKHLSQDCKNLLENAEDVIDVNLVEDPKYKVADDKLA